MARLGLLLSRRLRGFVAPCLLLVFALLVPVGAAQAGGVPNWGNLEPGPFAIGFRSEWRLDHARTYRTTRPLTGLYGNSKAPRPVLFNIWYPAVPGTGIRMIGRDYFDIKPTIPALAGLASSLATYARNIAASDLRRKPFESLDARDRAAVDAMLAVPGPARRNARIAAGRFPLIIYHAGFGSSFEDNVALCEYLASHGFVVVGSAFLDRGGGTLNVDGGDGSIGDIRMITQVASDWPNVDWSKIGLVGHSGGAQAVLKYQAGGSSIADAIVSLDTTEDSHSLGTSAWVSMTSPVLEHINEMTAPTMFFAPRTAIFQLADRMKNAERYLATTVHLTHNDYVSHGAMAADFESRSTAASTTAASAHSVREEYDQVAKTILLFFNGYLKDDVDSLSTLRGSRPLENASLSVEYLARGRTGTEAYSEDDPAPPSPRQLRLLVQQHGIGRGATVLERFRRDHGSLAIYAPAFAAIWLNELVSDGKPESAQVLLQSYRRVDPDLPGNIEAYLMASCELFTLMGKTRVALPWIRTAALLDPSNRDAAAKLTALEGRLAAAGP